MLFATYVLSGVLCAASGVFYAARQGSTDSTTGLGWEFQALTAVIIGGASVAGGRGTVWRAMLGAIIIFMMTNGLVRIGIPGYITSAAHRRHLAGRRRHRCEMGEEPRQSHPENLRQSGACAAVSPRPSIARDSNSPSPRTIGWLTRRPSGSIKSKARRM